MEGGLVGSFAAVEFHKRCHRLKIET